MKNHIDDSFATPKNVKIRSLGLRRSISRSGSTTPQNLIKIPISDIKVDYKSLETQCEPVACTSKASSPSTPIRTTAREQLSSSTNCRPYRLALSRRVRDKYTKKRLEFQLANKVQHMEVDNSAGISCQDTVVEESSTETLKQRLQTMTDDELLAEIKIKEAALQAQLEHEQKVQELKSAINLWKNGLSQVICELQSKIEPRIGTEQLLEHLRIPADMIKYINTEEM